MKYLGCTLVFAFLLVFYGCVTMRTHTMELLKPPMAIPKTMNGSVLLINNTIPQPANVGQYGMTLDSHLKDSIFPISYQVDTVVDLLLEYVTDRIKSEKFVKDIQIRSLSNEWMGKKLGSTAYLRADSLNKAQRLSINRTSKASLLLSLDGFLIESMASNLHEGGWKQNKRIVYVHSVWRAYDGFTDSLLVEYKRTDSLIWTNTYSKSGKLVRVVPPMNSTFPEIADFVAGEVYKVITPYWEPIQRNYYVAGNAELKMGADEVAQGNWEKAAEFWKYAYDNGKGLNPFRASVNMMLYCEQKGDVQGAYVWAQRADVTFSSAGLYAPIWSEYEAFKKRYNQINVRLEEMERLKPYLSGFVK